MSNSLRNLFEKIPPGYIIIMLFLTTQIIGFITGMLINNHSRTIHEFSELAVTPIAEKGSIWNSLFFIGYILIMAIIIYFGIRIYKGVMLFKGLEIFVVMFASSIVFFVILTVLGINPNVSMSVSLLIGFLLAVGKLWVSPLRNVNAVLSSAGVGALFGFSLGFVPAIVFAVLLSVYDYIAVFKTKHMIKFAERFTKQDLSFTIAAGPKPSREEMERLEKLPFEKRIKKIKRTELGTGDLVVPVMISVSAYPVLGLMGSVCIIICTTLALYLLMKYMTKKKQVLPALPPLMAGALIGIIISWILNFCL